MSIHPSHHDKRLLELLERWQTGDFSRADEQELQELAASDAFRRETVEGFWANPEADHSTHIAALHERLRTQTVGTRRVAFIQMLTAVAAVFLLVLGVIWLLPKGSEPAPMVQESAPQPIENQPIASNMPEAKTSVEEMRSSPGTSSPRLLQRNPAPEPMDAPKMAASPRVSTPVEFEPAPPVPVPSEEPREAELAVATAPETSDEVLEKNKEDQKGMDAGYAKASQPARSAASKAEQSKESMKKKALPSPAISQPVGGWTDFKEYLRKKARLTEAARQNNISGTVKIKFRLEENNQPVDFQVLQSLGYGCDEEAIRLLKAYSWRRGFDPEVTVDIPFIR